MQTDKTTPTLPKAARRPRRTRDISEQARAWLWLAHICDRRAGWGFDRLDSQVFDELSRPRALWRIAREGHCPDRHHPRRGFSLVDRFDALEPWKGTARIYRSRFWDLVAPRLMAREELEKLKRELLTALSLYQPDQSARLAAEYAADEYPEFAETDVATYVEQVMALAPAHDLDFLALLCVLFRLAMADMDLDVAVALRPCIRVYYRDLLDALEMGRFGLRGDVPFSYLIEQRIFRSDLSLPAQWAEDDARFWTELVGDRLARQAKHPRRLPSHQRLLVLEMAMSYVLHRPVERPTPLLRVNERIEAFEQQKPALLETHYRTVDERLERELAQHAQSLARRD